MADAYGERIDGVDMAMPELRLTPGGAGLREVRDDMARPLMLAWMVCVLAISRRACRMMPVKARCWTGPS